MLKLLLIGVGGGAGAMLRHLLAGVAMKGVGGGFPVGTLIVNATGCFAIGLLATLFAGPMPVRDDYRLAVIAGLLGGYTTYSAFAWETVSLANEGAWAKAAAYVLATNALALLGAFAGHRTALLFGPAGA